MLIWAWGMGNLEKPKGKNTESQLGTLLETVSLDKQSKCGQTPLPSSKHSGNQALKKEILKLTWATSQKEENYTKTVHFYQVNTKERGYQLLQPTSWKP